MFVQPYSCKHTLRRCILKNKIMAKVLRVIDPFFVMETGDTFEYSEDEKMYVSKKNEEFYKMDGENIDDIKSAYRSEFKISPEYAKALIKDGYLEEATEKENRTDFVNVFDEIDKLLNKYEDGLKTIEKDMAELPACVKVERESVLTNLITLLKHLKGLKK